MSGILTYQHLRDWPGAFIALTGLTIEQFERLLDATRPLDERARIKRLAREGRRRAPGGGRGEELILEDRLLMTLAWMHLHPNHEALAGLLGVSDSTVSRYLKHLGPELLIPQMEKLGYPPVHTPDYGHKRRETLGDLLQAIPELRELLR